MEAVGGRLAVCLVDESPVRWPSMAAMEQCSLFSELDVPNSARSRVLIGYL